MEPEPGAAEPGAAEPGAAQQPGDQAGQPQDAAGVRHHRPRGRHRDGRLRQGEQDHRPDVAAPG